MNDNIKFEITFTRVTCSMSVQWSIVSVTFVAISNSNTTPHYPFIYQSNRNNASNEPTREKQYGRFLLFLPNARTQIEHSRTTDIYRVVHKSLSSYLWLTESVQKWPLFFFNAARIVIQ